MASFVHVTGQTYCQVQILRNNIFKPCIIDNVFILRIYQLAIILKFISSDDMCEYHREEIVDRTESVIWTVYVILNEILCRIGPCILLIILNLLMIRDFRASIQRRKELKNDMCRDQNRRIRNANIEPELTNSGNHGGKEYYNLNLL